MINKLIDRIRSFIQEHKYALLLVLIILGVIYPFSLFIYIPKWDSINGYLPYRYFISDYVWNGHLPLWNPFQRFGYPGYADLQSGCWYPVVWFLMLFGKYDITSLILEVIITFLVAGLGMYKLSSYIHQCKKTAFVLGLSYAISGFMVGSTQLLVFLIGVAWLPWCIWALLKFFDTKNYKFILAAAVFASLQITGASPAYTIILAYIFLGMFVYFFWKQRSQREFIKKGFIGGIILVMTMLLLLLPYIQSFFEFFPYFNRGDKLEYQGFLIQNPFVLADYISFLFPYTVVSNSEWFNLTDLTLRNAYIGIIGILGFVFTLLQFKNRNSFYFPLLICTVLALVLALGDETFIYKYLYHLPGFGLFRHPSFFRGYAMFCMLLLAGFSLKRLITDEYFLKTERIILWLISGGIIILIFIAFTKTSVIQIQENLNQIFSLQEVSSSTFYSHLIINLIGLILIAWFCFLIKSAAKLSFFTTLILFLVLDLGLQTRLTYPTTMCYNIKHHEVKEYFKKIPNDFNQTYNHEPFKFLNDNQGLISTNGIWKNVATFNKCISSVGENPMRFNSFDAGLENGVLERNLENSLLSFPTKEFERDDSLQKGQIWKAPTNIQITNNSKNVSDVVVGYNNFTASIENNANHPQWLILNQNYHHLWSAYFNDVEIPTSKVNEMVLGVEIPNNSRGKIRFEYNSPLLIFSFLISLISYFYLLFYFILKTKKA